MPISMPIMGGEPTLAVDYFLVAGGGSGWVGGGGAGGYKEGTGLLIGKVTPITVGAGGIGAGSLNNGGNSSIGSLVVANGGGYGGGGGGVGQPGGSGGGGSGYGGSSAAGGAGTAGQGNNGGIGAAGGTGGGGAGGGAGGVGGNGAASAGGTGGSGISRSAYTNGTAILYAGGGGGAPNGAGGSGIGGVGGNVGGGNGVVNTGSGGGGIASSGNGSGGSGVVFVAYPGTKPKAIGGDDMYVSGANFVHRFRTAGTVNLTLADPTVGGNDVFTKLLLHMDGTVGATTFPDSSQYGHVPSSIAGTTVQVVGQAFPAFNEHARCLGASGAGIFMDGSPDFAFGLNDFTIDFWVAIASFTVPAANQLIFDFRPPTTQGAYPTLYTQAGGVLTYFTNTANAITGPALSLNNWYHIALTRSAFQTRMFVDGTQVGSTFADSTNYLCGANRPVICSSGYGVGTETNGYFNEFRISKGIARWTANFTRPAAPYS